MQYSYSGKGKEHVIDRAGEEARAFWSDIIEVRDDLQELALKEVELLKAEVSENTGFLARAGAWGAVALIIGFLFVAFAFVMLMFALETFLPLWLAMLITTGVIGLLLAVAGYIAYRNISQFSVTPKRAINSLKEDAEWAKSLVTSESVSLPGKGIGGRTKESLTF